MGESAVPVQMDLRGVSPLPVEMWAQVSPVSVQMWAQVSPVPVQMWAECHSGAAFDVLLVVQRCPK